MVGMSARVRLDDIWDDWRDERRREDRDVGPGGTLGSAWLAAEVRARLLEFLSSEDDVDLVDAERAERPEHAEGDERDGRTSRR